jgi:hypothetical protein
MKKIKPKFKIGQKVLVFDNEPFESEVIEIEWDTNGYYWYRCPQPDGMIACQRLAKELEKI